MWQSVRCGCHLDLTYIFFGVSACFSPAKIYRLRTSSMNRLKVLFRFGGGTFDWMQNFRPRPSVVPMPVGGDDLRHRLWQAICDGRCRQASLDIVFRTFSKFCHRGRASLQLKPQELQFLVIVLLLIVFLFLLIFLAV